MTIPIEHPELAFIHAKAIGDLADLLRGAVENNDRELAGASIATLSVMLEKPSRTVMIAAFGQPDRRYYFGRQAAERLKAWAVELAEYAAAGGDE